MKDFKGCTVLEFKIKNKFSLELSLDEIAEKLIHNDCYTKRLPNDKVLLKIIDDEYIISEDSLLKIIELVDYKVAGNKLNKDK